MLHATVVEPEEVVPDRLPDADLVGCGSGISYTRPTHALIGGCGISWTSTDARALARTLTASLAERSAPGSPAV